jgi:hypothetical protein
MYKGYCCKYIQAKLTLYFLKIKTQEYDALKQEIESLKQEVKSIEEKVL